MKSGSRSVYVPDRGDIVKLSFDPQEGHEQAGYRPAIILSPVKYEKRRELDSPSPKGAGWKSDDADLSALRLVPFVMRIIDIRHHFASTHFKRCIIEITSSPQRREFF